MLENPNFDKDATTGWTSATAPNYGGKGAEFYERTFNFYQTLTNMPVGIYQLKAQAFQRPGEPSVVYTQYKAGTSKISAELYIDTESTAVKNICIDSQRTSLHSSDKQLATGVYVPNSMDGAAKYFAKGLYDNGVILDQTTSGANFKVGIRCNQSESYYWTMFDSFRLYFYGQNRTIVGIETIGEDKIMNGERIVYDLSGRKIVNGQLPKGVYIINGKKVFVR